MQTIGQSFRNLWVIFTHEFSLYFISPIIYLVGAGWFLLGGIAFNFYLFVVFAQGSQEPSMSGTFSFMSNWVLLLAAPALTMRLIAEEINAGTHEILFTAPVRDWEIVVGKWLAAWMVTTVLIAISGIYALILLLLGKPDPGLLISNYLGLWLVSGLVLAIGVLASSLTKYQVVSFIVAVAIIFGLVLAYIPAQIIPGQALSDILNPLSLRNHLDTLFQQGVVEWTDLTYFVGATAIFLFLATQILGSRRWRA